jgi:alpha-mannosidase
VDPRIVQSKLEAIRNSVVRARWPIEGWEARTATFDAVGEYAFDGDWEPIGQDMLWPALRTLFLRAQATTPEGVDARDLAIEFCAEHLEGLLSVNGRPYAGIDTHHTRVLAPQAGALRLEAEFICVPQAGWEPAKRSEKARLRSVAFVQIDAAAQAAYYDLWFAWEVAQHAQDERRRALLYAAVEEAMLAIDLTGERAQLERDLTRAREILAARVGAIAPDPEAGSVYLTGHSHIDVAWLWPLRETVRKCGRTFSTACRLLERYPEYYFSCSQPQLYEYTRQHYPALYKEIKKWVRTGRWQCSGGMWVESDCNVPSGESLVRQVLHGVTFFQREFGARPTSLWLPDVFGYPASLPGILVGCGLRNFFTCKLHWQARNEFPVNLFWWEGIDGSRILAHIPRLAAYYNGTPNPEQLVIAWDNYHQKAEYPEVMLPFGWGDGGGGLTEEMLEFAARAKRYPSLPDTRQGPEERFFDGARRAGDKLPSWVGELYLETHRGTYTTHGEIKRANRVNELTLRDAEVFGVLANAQGAQVDLTLLQGAWSNLLLLQFHDILPGSSIGEVYREAAVDHARIHATATAVRDAALGALSARVDTTEQMLAVNSLSWGRQDIARAMVPMLSLDWHAPLEIVHKNGQAVPAQVVTCGETGAEIVFAPAEVPALGYRSWSLRQAQEPAVTTLKVQGRRCESRHYIIDLAEDGTLARLFDKRAGREVLAEGQTANQLQLFQDGPEQEAAWNVHATLDKRSYAWDPGTTIEVVETGPVRIVVRITKRYRSSWLVQDMILYDQSPRIDFYTRVHWQERQVLLKAAFPVEVRSSQATYEIQFGAVTRATHRNTSWEQEKFEVCAHRWVDLSEANYGVSLLNDCKYGHDVKGNVLRLTLLRGTERPDPDADRGEHTFTYALLPHPGDWRSADTVRRAAELNAPLLCVPVAGQAAACAEALPASHSFFSVEGPAILETLKPAEDGDGIIMRLYEPYGASGRVRVRGRARFVSVRECNHIEEPLADVVAEASSFGFWTKPYQVRTFRVVCR